MEIDEMKNIWRSIDDRLKKQELFNDNMVREMLRSKSGKSLRWFRVDLIVSMTAIFVIIPLTAIWKIYLPDSPKGLILNTYGTVALVLLAITLVYLIIKLRVLLKIDPEGELRNNFKWLKTFDVISQREKFAGFFIIPAIAAWVTYTYIRIDVPLASWILATFVFILAVLYYIYYYKRFYRRNMDTIQKSLRELKELDESPE